MSLEDRFDAKYTPAVGRCWIWNACRNPRGYGQIGQEKGGRTLRAHRVAWEIFRGKIPDGLCVLHACDNPSCVNPAHLFIGTPLDNTQDMDRKGRGWRPGAGSKRQHLATLRESQVVGCKNSGDTSRPKMAVGKAIGLRLYPDLEAEIETWRAGQDDNPSQPEAIRRLVRMALR